MRVEKDIKVSEREGLSVTHKEVWNSSVSESQGTWKEKPISTCYTHHLFPIILPLWVMTVWKVIYLNRLLWQIYLAPFPLLLKASDWPYWETKGVFAKEPVTFDQLFWWHRRFLIGFFSIKNDLLCLVDKKKGF